MGVLLTAGVLLTIFAQGGLAFPGSCEVPGPSEVFNYRCSTTSYDPVENLDGTELDLGADDSSDAISLPFDFPWFDRSVNEVYVSSEGFVCFTKGTSNCKDRTAQEIPDPDEAPHDLVACAWTDLDPTDGTVRYDNATLEDGTEAFVVEFDAVPHQNTDINNTFQIQLLDSGRARCMYETIDEDTTDNFETAAGIEDETGEEGVRLTKSKFNASEDGVVFGQAPDAPTDLVATAGPLAGEIKVDWTEVEDATSYVLHRRPAADSDDVTDIEVPGDQGPPFVDDAPELGHDEDWFYTVSAENDLGEGPTSEQVSATTFGAPTAPLNVNATLGDESGEIDIEWTAPKHENGTTTYHVYREGVDEPVLNVSGDTLNATDTGLPAGVEQSYNVTAENGAGESPRSETVSSVPAGPPSAPQNVTVTHNGDDTGLDVCWDAPAFDGGAEILDYTIDRSKDNSTFGLRADGVAESCFTDVAVDCNSFYEYKLSARNEHGTGPVSEIAARLSLVDCVDAPPQDPSFTLTDNEDGFAVSWLAPSGVSVDEYVVERTVDEGAYTSVGTTGDTSITDTDLWCGDIYTYKIAATLTDGNETVPVEVTQGPDNLPQICADPPANLAATLSHTAAEVTLTWDLPADTGLGTLQAYPVERSTDGGPHVHLGDQIDLSERTWTDPVSCSEFDYRVYTENAAVSHTEGAPDEENPRFANVTVSVECPSAPVNVTATEVDLPSAGHVNVSWETPETTGTGDLIDYTLERQKDDGAFSTLANVTSTSYNDTDVACDADYTYRVTPNNAFGPGPNATATVVDPQPCPSVPLNVAAQAGQNQGTPADAINVTWDLPEDTGWTNLTEYIIDRCHEGDDEVDCSQEANWHEIARQPASEPRYLVNGSLNASETWAYRVTAANENGASPNSTAVTATTAEPPGPPQEVVVDGDEDLLANTDDPTNATPTPSDAPLINWSALDEDEGADILTYHVWRMPLIDAVVSGVPTLGDLAPVGNWTKIATVPASQTSYTDEDAPTPGACYRVSANNTFESEPSPFDPLDISGPALLTKCTLVVDGVPDPGDVPDPDRPCETVTDTTGDPAGLCAPPENLEATSEELNITLEWDQPSPAVGNLDATEPLISAYRVYRNSTADCSEFEPIANVTGEAGSPPDTTYTDVDLPEDTTFCYHVTAVRGTPATNAVASVESNPSNVAAERTPTNPGAPPNVAVDEAAPGEAKLTWDAAPNGSAEITSYEIERSAACTGTWTQIANLSDPATLEYVDRNFTDGTAAGLPAGEYCYQIRAWNILGAGPFNGDNATITNEAPNAPQNEAAENTGSGEINVTWDALVPPSETGGSAIDHYVVDRMAEGGDWKNGVAETENATFSDDGLAPGVEFCYRISAVNTALDDDGNAVAGQEGSHSAPVCATA